jgi:lipopolysaccharide export system protein LptA
MNRALLPALLIVFAPQVLADDASRTAPISLRADRIEIDQKTGLSRYQGKVALNQGTLRLTADRATVERQGELLKRVTAEGKPATFLDRPEGQTDFIEGEALRMEYEALERKLRLVGQATVKRGQDRLTAGELHYHLNTETVIARRLDGRRVIATLNPQKPSAPAGETP